MAEQPTFDPKATPPPEPIIGSYRVVQALASGGMSSVHRAVHMQTGHEVALKMLPRALAKKPTMLQRFLREAKTAESLQHPNIVSIYDRGFDKGRHYLVLEFIPGGDFHERIRSKGPLSIPEVIRVMRQVAEGLRYAIGKGMVHRDIKPANLLLTKEGQVKITDLGLVLRAEEEDERVTRDGTTVGTVDYMAPEQARDSRATSVRSDIYSLGCTIYYLLTGQPPYPGGTLTEKLRRHAQERPVDVRKIRTDVPLDLSLLLQRMMAKRPEDRYDSHDELLTAINELDRPKSSGSIRTHMSSSGSKPPLALIDDEPSPPTPSPSSAYSIKGGVPAAKPAPLQALFDDDENRPPAPPSRPGIPLLAMFDDDVEDDPDDDDEIGLGGVDIAALGSLDSGATVPRPRNPGAGVPRVSAGIGHFAPAAGRPDSSADFLADDPDEFAVAGTAPAMRSSGSDSMKTWILRGLGIGLCIVFVVIVFQQVIALTRGPAIIAKEEPAPRGDLANEGADSSQLQIFTPKNASNARAGAVGPVAKPTAKANSDESAKEATPPSTVQVPREPEIPAETLALYIPEWALQNANQAVQGPTQTLRRMALGTDPSEVTSLRKALDSAAGTIEIADTGPYFIDDFRIAGKNRRIRAKKGVRPIVVIFPSDLEVVYSRPGLVVLDEADLEIEGVDFVVDLKGTMAKQKAFFVCRGSRLTLTDCTVTVVGGGTSSFALTRVESSVGEGTHASRIKLLRTLARGPNLVGFDLASGVGEFAILRSALVCGPSVVFSHGQSTVPGVYSDPGTGKFSFGRSLLVSRGPAFAVGGLGSVPRQNTPPCLEVRALASIFARIEDPAPAGLIAAHEDIQGTRVAGLEWLGTMNLYVGWANWLSSGVRKTVNIPNLQAAMKAWHGSERQGREAEKPWPAALGLAWASPDAIAKQTVEAVPILNQFATASPWLREKTLATFPDPKTPQLEAFEESAFSPFGAPPGGSASGVADYSFDLGLASGSVDLGEFVRKQTLPAGTTKMRVHVIGRLPVGSKPGFSGVKMPRGVGLEIVLEGSGVGDPAVAFTAVLGNEPLDALISVEEADLVLRHLRIARGGASLLRSVVRVNHGNLLLQDCRLTATNQTEPGGGNLVSFRAGPSGKTKPVCRMVDSLLVAGGVALSAEVGWGMVSLENTVIAGQDAAILLWPVAGRTFEADVVLDRCTVASKSVMVVFGPWSAAEPSPARPWVVSTHRTAFLDLGNRDSKRSVLLAADPEAIARGALAWQAVGDACEVNHFIMPRGSIAPVVSKPDVRQQWYSFWGPFHIRDVTGPRLAGAHNSVRFLKDPLNADGSPTKDLSLEATFHPGRKSLDVGADLRPLGAGKAGKTGKAGQTNQPAQPARSGSTRVATP